MSMLLDEIKSASTSISLKNIKIIYGKNIAVENLTLEIEQKELFVLLGPSGCGKTTTLNSIAGLIRPSAGQIWLGESEVTNIEKNVFLRPQDRDLAMVFQDYAIYPHMTVFNNMAFPLETMGMERELIKKKVTDTAKRLEIDHLLERKPKQLSGGQRQRVALGRSIVREPKAFLMDEPLSNLDAKLRVYARAELKQLHKRIGATIVYVTHDQIEAMSIGDRIAILNKGALEQVGTPDDVYNYPVNKFVAGFIGDPPINFVSGKFVQKENKVILDLGDELGTIDFKNAGTLYDKSETKEIILGIRPEHIEVLDEQSDEGFQVELSVIEPVGREFVLHLTIGKINLVAVVNAFNKNLKESSTVWIKINFDRVHIFDKSTEENLKLQL